MDDLTIPMDDEEQAELVTKQLRIDKNNLDEEFTDQAALYAYYAVMAENARANYEEIDLSLDVLEADLDERIREEDRQEGINAEKKEKKYSKITEKGIESKIHQDDEWQERSRQKIEANKEAGVMVAIRDAFRQRAQMLSAIAYANRPDLETDLRHKKDEAKKKIERGRRR